MVSGYSYIPTSALVCNVQRITYYYITVKNRSEMFQYIFKLIFSQKYYEYVFFYFWATKAGR
jgi:hypothetical protein